MLKLKVRQHSLSTRIIRFRAVITGQPIIELFARRERSFVKSLELVNLIIAENSLLLY